MSGQLWVWEETAPDTFPAGYDMAVVKVADGNSLHSGGGFSWADNFRAWQRRFGARVAAWAVAYQGDGDVFGRQTAAAAAGAAFLVLDVEDWNGKGWTDAQISAAVGAVRAHWGGASLGYSSYATAHQCEAHGINQPLLESLCDLAFPQVYFPYQVGELGSVWADHRHCHPILSPADDRAWLPAAKEVVAHGVTPGFWRMGVSGWEEWGMTLGSTAASGGHPTAGGDPMKPAAWQSFPAGQFVAWDGKGWWVTDCISSRPATEEQARGMHTLGYAVRWWPNVGKETHVLTVGQ